MSVVGEGSGEVVFLFESSTHVFWAEDIALEEGIPVAVIPAPKDMKDHCGLALQTLSTKAGAFGKILDQEGIPFRTHP